MHILSKGKKVTTHKIPASINTISGGGGNELLLNMKRMMNEPLEDNPAVASMCVTLAILEAMENSGELIEPKDGYSKEHAFNWGQGGSILNHNSISFTVNKLFFEVYDETEESDFKQLIQDKLLPRGLEILVESDYEELCDLFVKVLSSE